MTPVQPSVSAPALTPAPELFSWTLDPAIRRLPPEFYALITPAERIGSDPQLIHASTAAAALLDIAPKAFTHPAFAGLFAGHIQIAGFEPLATVYSGHQFGTYVPRLGDGRALLIAQVRNQAGELWDVQLKGAGHTPYSRMGDGRAVMRSSLREYMCSEHMAALGIPTTRALAIVATNEIVYREKPEPGAIVTRLAPSLVRFGHFEYFHHTGRPDLVRLLADQVIAEHFPELPKGEERFGAWYREVVLRTARLMALWQANGFCHGVMNSDNMSILGLTIDYGPFGFLDAFDPQHICNHSDHTGRYAYDQQPGIGLWNLQALAVALTSLIETDVLKDALSAFAPAFLEHFAMLMHRKLGLSSQTPQTAALIDDLLQVMADGRADFTLSFRGLSGVHEARGRDTWLALFAENARPDAATWIDRYIAEEAPSSARSAAMNRANPKYVLRNWVAESVVRNVEDHGDRSLLERVMQILQAPFDEHQDMAEFAAPPPEPMRCLKVSCSS